MTALRRQRNLCSAEYEIEPGLDYEAVAVAMKALEALELVS